MSRQSVETYLSLTMLERDAFVDVWNRAHRS